MQNGSKAVCNKGSDELSWKVCKNKSKEERKNVCTKSNQQNGKKVRKKQGGNQAVNYAGRVESK